MLTWHLLAESYDIQRDSRVLIPGTPPTHTLRQTIKLCVFCITASCWMGLWMGHRLCSRAPAPAAYFPAPRRHFKGTKKVVRDGLLPSIVEESIATITPLFVMLEDFHIVIGNLLNLPARQRNAASNSTCVPQRHHMIVFCRLYVEEVERVTDKHTAKTSWIVGRC